MFRTSEGWRIAFLVGPALAIVILVVRRNLPESPRWLITHGRAQDEAEAAIRRIESSPCGTASASTRSRTVPPS